MIIMVDLHLDEDSSHLFNAYLLDIPHQTELGAGDSLAKSSKKCLILSELMFYVWGRDTDNKESK